MSDETETATADDETAEITEAENAARAALQAQGKDGTAEEVRQYLEAGASPPAGDGEGDQGGDTSSTDASPDGTSGAVEEPPGEPVTLDDGSVAPQADPAAVMAAQALLESLGWTVTPPAS